MDHTYEEVRLVVIDLLATRERSLHMADETRQYNTLRTAVADVLEHREDRSPDDRHHRPALSANDRAVFHEVFWDLFRHGIITPGINDANLEFPHFASPISGEKSWKTRTPTSSTISRPTRH